MKLWRWDDGRQKSGYGKMLLAASRRLKFDLYLLKLPNGVEVPKHTDAAVEGFEHHRINITLKKPCVGTGVFHVAGTVREFLFGRAVYFRPDIHEHWMTPIEMIWSNESVYMLSLGWLRKK